MTNVDIKKAFTHGGIFHADDVFGAALLKILHPEIVIERGMVVPDDYDGIVFDIGKGRFDHHQNDSMVRDNGVPYSAFGLLWEEFGTEILEDEDAKQFDKDFVQVIDWTDNTGEKNILSSCISDMNPCWDGEEQDTDKLFLDAVEFAKAILVKRFETAKSKRRAYYMVKEMIEKVDGNILIMDKMIPWKEAVKGTDILYVIFPSIRGGYMVQAVPTDDDNMIPKHPFPIEWRGADAERLKKMTGVKTFQFCHMSGYISAVEELEDAVLLAKMAIDLNLKYGRK